jgi:uncharacterized protein (TIGR02611 family)
VEQRNLDRPAHRPAILQRIRANPTGRVALKTVIGVLGASLVAAGLVLVPLPGPGWLIVLAGLTVLAIEYAWARHVLRYARKQLTRWTAWLTHRSWLIRLTFGAAGIILIGAAVWVSIRISLGIDLATTTWHYLAG